MFERWVESGLLDVLENTGIGCIAFSPLAQGLLTNKYLSGIPADSRAGKSHGALNANQITPERLKQIEALNQLAISRGQSLAQMAIAWLLKDSRVTSVLIGASSVAQLDDNLLALKNTSFTAGELECIELIIKQ
jgi:L-glyceraldehyde 3-phosphate reductase